MWQAFCRLLIIVTVCVSLSESQSDVYQMMDKRQTRRYCGSNLVEIMQFVCNGSYNGMSTHLSQKKSETDDDFWMQLLQGEEQYKYPFRSRSSAHRIFKRYPGGIAYECCISKGCNIYELRSYCAPSSK